MTELGKNLAILLVRELETFEREIDLFADDERIWSTAPGCPNSAANSALHVAGNLRHFVGAVLGRSGYVRDRDREFGCRSGTRSEVKAELRAAIRDVASILPALTDAVFASDFPEPVNGLRLRTDRFLMHPTFCYVSGAGTDANGRAMWARVKGRTENDLLSMPFRGAYMFRPAYIQPRRGLRSKTGWYRAFYAAFGMLYPVLRRALPSLVTSTDVLGRALVRVGLEGFPKPILETRDINRIG